MASLVLQPKREQSRLSFVLNLNYIFQCDFLYQRNQQCTYAVLKVRCGPISWQIYNTILFGFLKNNLNKYWVIANSDHRFKNQHSKAKSCKKHHSFQLFVPLAWKNFWWSPKLRNLWKYCGCIYESSKVWKKIKELIFQWLSSFYSIEIDITLR